MFENIRPRPFGQSPQLDLVQVLVSKREILAARASTSLSRR
jgi:hypothetical protein